MFVLYSISVFSPQTSYVSRYAIYIYIYVCVCVHGLSSLGSLRLSMRYESLSQACAARCLYWCIFVLDSVS